MPPVHIHPDIAQAFSLPAPLYFELDTFAREREAIFFRTWQLVSHRSPLSQPGDYITFDLLGEPLLLVRGHDATLRAFYNVCRHRAGPPAEGCGSRKLFRCAYHGWTYDLDGRLLHAPEFEGVHGFDPHEFALAPVRVAEWFNLVFVNLDPDARPLQTVLGPMTSQAERFDFPSMQLAERRTYDMKCNWKTYIDNYLEGYHLPSVHPALNRELDYNEYLVEPSPGYVRQWSPIRGAQPGDTTPRRYAEARHDLTTDYFWAFPNWMLNCYPDNVSVNIILPIDPERTLAIFEFYLPADQLNQPAAKASVEFSHQVQLEDVAICETVQRNLHSRSYQRGRYSAKQEKGVHAFHRMYADAMSG